MGNTLCHSSEGKGARWGTPCREAGFEGSAFEN
jgi:hypothetical protein